MGEIKAVEYDEGREGEGRNESDDRVKGRGEMCVWTGVCAFESKVPKPLATLHRGDPFVKPRIHPHFWRGRPKNLT